MDDEVEFVGSGHRERDRFTTTGTARISPAALTEVRRALGEYEHTVGAAPLTGSTKATYLVHARNFVRWIEGSFEPGSRR